MNSLPLEAGAFYIMDLAYLDFERHYRMNLCKSFFDLMAKASARLYRLKSTSVNRNVGVICDQIVKLPASTVRLGYWKNAKNQIP